MAKYPSGYTKLNPFPDQAVVLREDLTGAVTARGLTSFPEPSGTGETVGPAGGRSPVTRITLDEGPPLVLKTYRRGGLAGRILGDRYTNAGRVLDELRVCAAAAGAGLHVPLIQIVWIKKISAFHHRFAAATREISGAMDAFQALRRTDGQQTERRDLLTGVATEIRKLHDAGIDHPDLNLGNILVAYAGGRSTIHLIDFDKAVLRDSPLCRRDRNRALARIYRSLVKLSLPGPPPLTPDEKDLFLSAYWQDHRGRYPALRRRCRWTLVFHRLWWRVSPPRPREREP